MPAIDYLSLLKLKQTALLLFTAVAAYLAAPGEFKMPALVGLLAAEFLAIGGTTAVNMYFDRDIDSRMERTRRRPLPAGRIPPRPALVYGILLFLAGLIISLPVGFWLTFTIFLGFAFDIFVYTLYFKRRTFLNILFGGVAGGMPAMGGWLTKTGFFEPGALLAFALVFLWIPMHIWFISIYYMDDYARSGVPMLPVVVGERKTTKCIIGALALLEAVVITMYVLKYVNIFTLGASTVLTLLSIRVMLKFLKEPRREIARRLFKFASPYLAMVFTFMVVERLLNLI